jgi:hypothetical protein
MSLIHRFFKFRHPTTIIIVGPTQAGKTEYVIKLLANKNSLFTPIPEKIYWAYGQKNDKQMKKIQDVVPDIEFIEGCPNTDHFDPNINNLLILDDLMDEMGKSQECTNLFTRGSHHKNITVIAIKHNLFDNGRFSKTQSLSGRYYGLFNSPRDSNQIAHFGRQIFPQHKNFLPAVLSMITENDPYAICLIDLHPQTPESFRVSTGHFPDQIPRLFVPTR